MSEMPDISLSRRNVDIFQAQQWLKLNNIQIVFDSSEQQNFSLQYEFVCHSHQSQQDQKFLITESVKHESSKQKQEQYIKQSTYLIEAKFLGQTHIQESFVIQEKIGQLSEQIQNSAKTMCLKQKIFIKSNQKNLIFQQDSYIVSPTNQVKSPQKTNQKLDALQPQLLADQILQKQQKISQFIRIQTKIQEQIKKAYELTKIKTDLQTSARLKIPIIPATKIKSQNKQKVISPISQACRPISIQYLMFAASDETAPKAIAQQWQIMMFYKKKSLQQQIIFKQPVFKQSNQYRNVYKPLNININFKQKQDNQIQRKNFETYNVPQKSPQISFNIKNLSDLSSLEKSQREYRDSFAQYKKGHHRAYTQQTFQQPYLTNGSRLSNIFPNQTNLPVFSGQKNMPVNTYTVKPPVFNSNLDQNTNQYTVQKKSPIKVMNHPNDSNQMIKKQQIYYPFQNSNLLSPKPQQRSNGNTRYWPTVVDSGISYQSNSNIPATRQAFTHRIQPVKKLLYPSDDHIVQEKIQRRSPNIDQINVSEINKLLKSPKKIDHRQKIVLYSPSKQKHHSLHFSKEPIRLKSAKKRQMDFLKYKQKLQQAKEKKIINEEHNKIIVNPPKEYMQYINNNFSIQQHKNSQIVPQNYSKRYLQAQKKKANTHRPKIKITLKTNPNNSNFDQQIKSPAFKLAFK